jgi:hypothetical protein
MPTAIDHILRAQASLIAALDSRDAAAIENASAALAMANTALQAMGAVHAQDDLRQKLAKGIMQSDAARTRVNCLSQWTRQRIDRLDELRGRSSQNTYSNIRNI